MMRWLKDKKKDKRSNSTSQSEDGVEDDYGFGKDKSASKSPSTRRQLPPTPATPEEKSPHIYEEIPDLPLSCMPESEKALLQSKFGKPKNGSTSVVGAMPESAGITSKVGTTEANGISPYMVVPVDNEVRQTPTDFHRNGTPEVHCDVIVRDTHCEILLTRKPKVSAFRLDSTVMSESGESFGGRKIIRNNTHFCSRDWRASADVNSSGNMSSAFSLTSSAISSSSVSKIPSGAAPLSLTLTNVPEINSLETDTGDTSEKGVITYSSASNFIPRATKLTFNPLTGTNPYKAFGSESSDGLSGAGYSLIKDDKLGTSGSCHSSVLDKYPGSKCVTYASIQSRDVLDPSSESRVTYASIQDQRLEDTKSKQNYSFDDLPCQFQQHKFLSNLPNNTNDFACTNRTGIIRSLSPTNSSNCIYALVTFPTEPNHYNTISEVMPIAYPENCQIQTGVSNSDRSGAGYSSATNSLVNETSCMPSKEVISPKVGRVSCFGLGEIVNNSFKCSRGCCDSDNITGLVCKAEAAERNPNGCKEQGSHTDNRLERPESLNRCGDNLELDFCLCSDEHSSSFGCPEAKHSQDDDITSFSSAPIDGPNSCRNCGRLVRQITYSESYSDETYEHVYASRLLIRTGRRFSSPDISFPEASISEFQGIHNFRNHDSPYAVSRDDSWTSARNSDIIPPSYNTAANKETFNITEDVSQCIKTNTIDNLRPLEVSIDSSRQMFDLCSSSKQGKSCVSADSTTMYKSNDLRFQTSCNINAASIAKSNFSTNMEWSNIKTDQSLLADKNCSKVSVNTDLNRMFVEQIVDQTKKRDSTVMHEQKSSAFTGILSKFSRTKSSKATKLDSSEILNQTGSASREWLHQSEVQPSDKNIGEIPQKNTKKLSKFFQLLSSKESSKMAFECLVSSEADNQNEAIPKDIGKAHSLKTVSPGNFTTSPNLQKYREDAKQSAQLSKEINAGNETNGCRISTENHEKTSSSRTAISGTKQQISCTYSANVFTSASDQQLHDTSGNHNKGSISEETTNIKQFKTDSGDTCYEYDISTSSEGEQAGYECCLSKIKKTLNLEDEVRHIAESYAGRRKRLCKRCKQEGLYSTIGDTEEGAVGGDRFCPHLAAKFGDLRAIWEDMVVDQRAAILDCLTDFTYNPYNIRNHGQDSCCRECGCEILTSDSESLTTVYSLLSQQFRMTSPNCHTQSCDSDEGTMADNSDESADEKSDGKINSKNNCNNSRIHYDGNSSGFDEPKGKSACAALKPRKKERKERKSTTSMNNNPGYKEVGVIGKAPSTVLKTNSHTDSISHSSDLNILPAEGSYQLPLKDIKEASHFCSSDNFHKSILPRNKLGVQSTNSPSDPAGLCFSLAVDSKDNNLDHSKSCDNNKSGVNIITDKVLQDIYAPLPPKALSVLTSRNYSSPAGSSCNCGKELLAPLATVTSHLATGENLTSPTGCVQESCFFKASPARPAHCISDKKDGVVPVQKHFEQEGKNSSLGALSNLSDRKDINGLKCDQDIMDAKTEVEVFANKGCSSSWKNSEPNNCILSQTKPGSRIFTKEPPTVPMKDGSPLKNCPPAKLPNELRINSDFRIGTSSLQKKSKGPQILFPHTKNDSTVLTLTAENVIKSSEQLYSENPSNDLTKRPIVESRKETANKKYSRKHRLGLVALDLLPESTVDGDAAEEVVQIPKRISHQPRKLGVVEKMTKIFENNSDSNIHKKRCSNENDISLDVTDNNKTVVTNSGLTNKNNSSVNSSYKTTQPSSTENCISYSQECRTKSPFAISPTKYCISYSNESSTNSSLAISPTKNCISDFQESSTSSSLAISPKFQSMSDTNLSSQNRHHNLCGRPRSTNSMLIDSHVVSDKDLVTLTKSLRSSSGSKILNENDAKLLCTKSDNENCRLKIHESKSTRNKSGKMKSSISNLTESRLAKQRSPTPSSSSVSSSSSSKKKNSNTKHKISKKSYHKKRSKHRSERSKRGNGKEERTYYYFSSDFSDIDVMEIENSKSYATGSKNILQGKKIITSKKQSSSSNEVLATSSEQMPNQLPKPSIEGVDGESCGQEVYTLPSSSAELRSKRESVESSNSPQASPELTKLRKTKKVDLYKTKKTSNTLLSDVIIRNYDMQVYVNI